MVPGDDVMRLRSALVMSCKGVGGVSSVVKRTRGWVGFSFQHGFFLVNPSYIPRTRKDRGVEI